MPAGSTACVKCTKKMNGITTSDKSIANFGGDNDNDNNNDYRNYDEELSADDSVS